MKKHGPCLIVLIALSLYLPGIVQTAPAGLAGIDPKDTYDRTCTDITAPFRKFMRCNASDRYQAACAMDAAAPSFLFDYADIEKLRRYHIIMLPGGDFDAFGELISLCEGEHPEDLERFFNRHPFLEPDIKRAIEKEVCPDFLEKTEQYYDKFLDAFIEYELFCVMNDIACTRLQFSKADSPLFIGDRADKVSLLGNTIDELEARYNDNDTAYILIGHSFGGLNVGDFLLELTGAHTPGTPEDRLFANTSARQWTADKKERIFKKIRGVVFLNTFVQGKRDSEQSLRDIARAQGVQADDAVEHYIQRVLNNYATEDFESDNITRDTIYHLTLRSNRYRVNYFFQDKNTAGAVNGTPVKNAIDRIAREKAVISVGCYVPRLLPYLRVAPNYIVHLSKKKWRDSGIRNDGMVETYATILPRQSTEFALIPDHDHGTLVLRPQVVGISQAHHYDQLPFIKTLLARMMSKIDELPADD